MADRNYQTKTMCEADVPLVGAGPAGPWPGTLRRKGDPV